MNRASRVIGASRAATRRLLPALGCCAAIAVWALPGYAQHLQPMPRAARIYAENCQGCHGWTGVSVTEIPTLAGRIGYFARTPQGRAYLMQVPNVALNPSSDEDIALMMNWLLDTYSRAQLPPGFEPYSADEVARLRKARIDAPADRRRVIEQLVALKEIPSADVLAIPHASLY